MTQPIDKAFKIMKNKQFANMGPTKPAAGNPQQQQFPESAPMPNSKQVQQLLLQMAHEIHFDEAEQEQLNQDFKGGLRNVYNNR